MAEHKNEFGKASVVGLIALLCTVVVAIPIGIGAYAGKKHADEKALTNKINEVLERGRLTASLAGNPHFNIDGQTIRYGLRPTKQIYLNRLNDELSKVYKETYGESDYWDKTGMVYYENGYYYRGIIDDELKDKDKDTLRKWAAAGTTSYGWFECEPQVWSIVKQDGDTYSLISQYPLDMCAFNIAEQDENDEKPINRYADSSVRKYLINQVYERTFYISDKYIQETVVDNSPASMGKEDGLFEYENTTDKIYLPSILEYKKLDSDIIITELTNEERGHRMRAEVPGIEYYGGFYYYNKMEWTRSFDVEYYKDDDKNYASTNQGLKPVSYYYAIRPMVTLKYSK